MSAALVFLPQLWASEELLFEVVPAALDVVLPTPLEPNLAFYRKYTEAMLRRYTRFSMEAGRVPSMLGQEMFRGKVTSYKVHSFEDVVIFVHDVGRCLERLSRVHQLLLTRIAMQEYTLEETATMMRTSRRAIVRRYDQAMDRLTAIFLEVRLLEPQKACQEGSMPWQPINH